MSGARTLRCAHCGADVEVASGASLVVTCGHCDTLLLRTDVEPVDLGRVAQPAPLASQFQCGTSGVYRGAPFVVRGFLQLDHGAGPWNEWAAERANGEWIWIAEAQGELLVFEEAPLTAEVAQALAKLATQFPADLTGIGKHEVGAGRRVSLGPESWLVTEVGEGEVLTCRGELPVRPALGSRTRYIDLGAGADAVATVDLTRAEPELLVGRRVGLAELALDEETRPDVTPERVEALRLRCPQCGGELVVRDPQHALRIACLHCHHLLERSARPDAARLYAVLEAQESVRPKSPLPLGKAGRLRGEDVIVLGALERRVRAEGEWYPWREVLLRNRRSGAYSWIVESDGHWLLATPVPPAAIHVYDEKATYAGVRYKDFTGGAAEVHWVVGEFYWRVARGDQVQTADYVHVASQRGLSIERTPTEITSSRLEGLTPEEVRDAFDLKQPLPTPRGVGMLQRNPRRPGVIWRVALGVCAALVVLRIAFGALHAQSVVYDAELGPTPNAPNAETVDFSDPFDLSAGRGNVRVELRAPQLAHGWIGLTGALVDLDSGRVTTFGTEAQRYSGFSGGENWSEGNGRGTTWIGGVPRGRYRLRLAAQGYDDGLNARYRVRVTNQVPRTLWLLLFMLPLPLLALCSSIAWLHFESLRWQNSDHPWTESS